MVRRTPAWLWLRQFLLGLVVCTTSTLARQIRVAAGGGSNDKQSQIVQYRTLVTTTTTTAPNQYVFVDNSQSPWYASNGSYSFLGFEPGAEKENVKCGSHYAENCAGCPKGHGSEWCNGDCKWDPGLGCVLDEHDVEEAAATTTSTTTGHMEHGHAGDVNYTLHPGQHCGGTPIQNWAGGGPASYGLGYASNLKGCEMTCALHGDCSGFTVRHADHMCSLWSMGVLQPYDLAGHDCHEKIRTGCPAPKPCPKCIECPELPPGVTTTPCPTTTMKAVSVKCGSHYAEQCSLCPQGHGAAWCGGDCRWDTQLGCVSKLLEAGGTTTTTTPAGENSFEQPYIELKGTLCGGSSINTWLKGGNTHYGEGYENNVDGCKKTCALHDDCLGFSYRHHDQQCSLWAGGLLSPHPVPGYDCFRKVVDIRCPGIVPCAPCPVCGQVCDVTVEDKLVQQMTIENVDFAALKEAPAAMGQFENQCLNVFSKNAGVPDTNVVINLAAGSIHVRAEITPPDGMDCESLQFALGQNEGLGGTLVSAITDNVEGMASFTTGPLEAGPILQGVESVMVSASDPCSVQDGSAGSAHYPCNCGGKTCLMEEICTAEKQECMGVRLLLKEAVSVEMEEWQLEKKLRATKRMMLGLTSEVGGISQELMDAAQMAADTGKMARGNAAGLRERAVDADALDMKVSKYNASIGPLEKRLNASELGNLSKVAKGLAINYTWAKIGMYNLTELPIQVAIGQQAIGAYKTVVKAEVTKTIDTVLGSEINEMVTARQEAIRNFTVNSARNRSLRGPGNDQGGGFPLPVQAVPEPSDGGVGCPGCGFN